MIGRTNSTFGGAVSLPDGATVTPVNDVQTWLKCAGIKDKTYTTVSQVVADTNTMFLLTSDENAMKYLARSTDFADTICADETSMTYLGQSAYVDSTVLNSDLWVSSIKSSQYWDKIYTQQFTIHAGAYETITIDGYGGSFTTNADGTASHALPLVEITLTGSVSGQSFTRTVASDTTDVYVMPEGALYWYGNECTDITGGWTCGVMNSSCNTSNKNTNDIYLKDHLDNDYQPWCRTNNMMNKGGYTKIKIKSKVTFTPAGGSIPSSARVNIQYLTTETKENPFGGYTTVDTHDVSSTTSVTAVAELEDLPSGQYIYVFALLGNEPHTAEAWIYEVWFE